MGGDGFANDLHPELLSFVQFGASFRRGDDIA